GGLQVAEVVETFQLTVDADDRRGPHFQMEVGGVALDDAAKEFIDDYRHWRWFLGGRRRDIGCLAPRLEDPLLAQAHHPATNRFHHPLEHAVTVRGALERRRLRQ